MPSYKYPKLNNTKWLYKKYIEEGLSTRKIAELLSIKTCNSVRQALIRNDIPVRTVSDGLTLNRKNNFFIYDDKTKQVINGSLLGDGSLTVYNKHSEKSYPYFHKTNKYLDHIEFVAKLIFGKRFQDKISTKNDKRFDIEYYTLRSLSQKILKPEYDKWYPESNGYKKLVPRDLILTPATILHWFMDDGCCYYRKQRNSYIVIFCSESFSKEDNLFLVEQLCSMGIKSTLRKINSGTGWRIRVSETSVPEFYKIIGECPVESLKYKWEGM